MTPEEIVELWNRLRSEGHNSKERMRQMAEIVDGDLAVPLPELGATERPAVVNLAYRGTQTFAQSLAQLQPLTKFGPLKTTKLAREEAQERMRVTAYWDQEDKMPLLDAQRGRYLFAYGSAPSRVDVDLLNERPVLSVPTPLNIYAPRPAQVNDICPPFGIATMHMSLKGIVARYGGNPQVLLYLKDWSDRPEEEFWILEYADADEIHLVLAGPVLSQHHEHYQNRWATQADPSMGVTLWRMENRTEMCPWVAPGLVNLNKAQGYFDQIVGMYQSQAVLQGIELQQAARSVFQETWLVGRPGEVPQVVVDADPIGGAIGEIRGADMKTIAPDPQFHTHMVEDRLQEAAMMTAALPADVMGRAASNVRTGARGSQLTEAAMSPGLHEAQTIMALAREEEVKRKIAFDKAYLNKAKTIHVDWRGSQVETTYDAEDLWKTDRCVVSYPVAGTDSNSLTILVGQNLNMGLMSKRQARELLPLYKDPDGEESQVNAEQLEAVFMEKLAEMVGSPDSPLQPIHIAKLVKLVRNGESPVDAFEKIQAEAQKEQTTVVEPGSPETAPGLGGPGAIPPPTAEPNQGQRNMAALMGTLRIPERTVGLSNGGQA